MKREPAGFAAGAPHTSSEPPAGRGSTQVDVLDLVDPLRRFVASRVEQAHEVDDVVQETVSRVLTNRDRLEESTLIAYAIAVAKNLIASGHRDADMARRHAHRVIDLREPDRPEELVLAAEEQAALHAALAGLPAHQRELLLSHVHDGQSLTAAGGSGRSAGGAAAQLARTRARLRLDYVLALRAVDLPSARCRPVLLTLSAGDRRRQVALRAGEHLLTCATCASLSEPLLHRRRALAGVVPLISLGALHGRLVRAVQQHPATSVAVAGATAAGVGALLVLTNAQSGDTAVPLAGNSGAARPSPSVARSSPRPGAAGSSLRGPDGPVLPAAGSLKRLVGQTVVADHVRVLAVSADEGFWVGNSAIERVWVQLSTAGESTETIRVGQQLSFRARVVANDAGFVRQVGLGPAEGAATLVRQQAHLSLPATSVTIEH